MNDDNHKTLQEFAMGEIIKELRAERDALKAELQVAKDKLNKAQELADWHQSHRAFAEAQLEAARKQEPYGYLHTLQTGSGNIIKRFCFPFENPQLGPVREYEVNGSVLRPVPLYASPAPAQQLPEDARYIIDPRLNDDGEYYLRGKDINAILKGGENEL